ncbi:MAG: hypothetical protein RI554_11025 [Trueperaceae bacterium]|nr:hypothetical protein [Trueperaceae bacterium]
MKHRVDRFDWRDLQPTREDERQKRHEERMQSFDAKRERWRDHMRLRNMFWRDQGVKP